MTEKEQQVKNLLSYAIGLPLDALLFMWAGHSFNQNWNWGQAFWISFFYNGILNAINVLKEQNLLTKEPSIEQNKAMTMTIKIMAGLLVVPLVLLMSACAPDKPDPIILSEGLK